MLTRQRSHKLAAMAVIACLFLCCTGCASIRGQHKTQGYCAVMADSIGLYQGNAVTRMGFPIGTVDELDTDGLSVRVTFSLDPGIGIPALAKAVTRAPTILADRSLELAGGDPTAGQLEPGACIPLERTATAKSISESIGAVAEFLNQLTAQGDGDTVNRFLRVVDGELQGNGPVIRDALANLAAGVRDPGRGSSSQFLGDIASVTDLANTNWSAIDDTLMRMGGVLSQYELTIREAAVLLGPPLAPLVRLLLDAATHYRDIVWNTLDTGADVVRLLSEHTGVIVMYAGTLPNIIDGVRSFWSRIRLRDIPVVGPRVAAGPASDGRICASTEAAGGVQCGLFYGVPPEVSSIELLQAVLDKPNSRP